MVAIAKMFSGLLFTFPVGLNVWIHQRLHFRMFYVLFEPGQIG